MGDLNALQNWFGKFQPGQLPAADLQLLPVTGDAGFRAYFRSNTQPSFIAALAPPEHENNPAFVNIAIAMAKGGVHVPKIYAVDYERGFLLQEDLGETLYLDVLNRETQNPLYERAEATLLQIQKLPADSGLFPAYDAALLRRELELFPEWFVGKLLGVKVDAQVRSLFDEVFSTLLDSAAEQPQVVVHRDFHSRNLLVLDDGGVGVIDFQDAVFGPLSYDLVSLLRDCYIRWPQSLVEQRVEGFRRKLLAQPAGEDAAPIPDAATFLRWFDLMGLQRHLKVLGIFARLSLRDGKTRYLADLPLVLRYVLEVAQKHPETQAFYQWFVEHLEPQMRDQKWYQPWQTAGESA
ncbi:MAG: phosphotransferase [Gammaproteobacteria bacterium]|nr:phosphotransferase [Gammaproteobacteria bacterium]MBQ0839467.1 phosphotransferase [Gammaproteobacteria bacterium]